ncbi:FAD-dependent oxidoreductase [Streptomyces filamentosus]|uniref:Isorenieratene synthase n=1 Tax=Streptomyces filamentosus TaxID=67294 RepID=A0A919BYG8_STRFL|nr:FAD-dependent oxidoreductase [Streptomyces filamentosus]KAA6210996.1 FAD-dependent oxidoreductase [Streptomyces filamentosus]GHG29910.1 isorenieratene synthase [Streptomyces filamentosus]
MRPSRNGTPARGRDRRAVVVPAHDGRPRTPPGHRPACAVVGGGIAGIAAATILAERGVDVTLYEREPTLGGRLAGWADRLGDGSEVTMSRGFHAFFRQYYNLRGLLRRVDPGLDRLTALPDYPLLHGSGLYDSFARVPRTPPWSALGFVALSPSFGWGDLGRMDARAALPLLDVRAPDVHRRFDDISARDFLHGIGFPPAAQHLAFEVFSRSFFADPGELSAAELVLMFHIYFLGSSEGLLFDVPDEPYPQALWDPLGAYLRGHGVRILTGTGVREVAPAPGGGHTVLSDDGPRHADAVVLATDTDGLRAIAGASPGLCDAPWRARIGALRTAPPFLVSRLWLDRPVDPRRPGFLGTSGFGPLDNISVLDRWEGEAARWAARTGGSVVELHAYAVDPAARAGALSRELVAQLRRAWPETRAAAILDERHELRSDCPLFEVGGHRNRPTVHTPDPTVTVAGDLVRTEYPVALMERAATTGFLAANAHLRRWGLRGQTLWTVPMAGRSAVLRFLARAAGDPVPAG